MRKYDVESFCVDLKAIVSANFNAKLLEIDAEKADAITLKPLNSSAYFFQELNNETVNYDPYLLYSVEDLPSVENGMGTSLSPVVHFIIVVTDMGQDSAGIGARMLRYQRALKEVFEEHWTENTWGVKIKVSSMVPIQFSLLNSSNQFRAIGVAVAGSFA